MVGKADSGAVTVIHKPQGIISDSLRNNGAAVYQIIGERNVHGLAGVDTVLIIGVAGDFSVDSGGRQLAARPGKAHAVATS